MITTFFSKSNPFNYVLVTVLFISIFFLGSISLPNDVFLSFAFLKKIGILTVLIATIYMANFVTKRNGLSKDSTFTFFLVFLFLVMFPSIFENANLVLSNFFVLLSLRRLISLQSLIAPKEKIFDASIWIFVASLFHFWAILFIFLVFISIIFHVSRDYRNWILPFIAFFAVAIIFVFLALLIDKTQIELFLQSRQSDFALPDFSPKYQNTAVFIFSIFSLLFFGIQVFTVSSKPQMLHASYKKVMISFVIAGVIFLISNKKTDSLLVFTFMPTAVMATSFFESAQPKWLKESVIGIIIFCSFLLFYLKI